MSDQHLKLNPSPPGQYGVFCEPIGGQMRDPCWLNGEPTSYEEAVKKADEMCRCNDQWHYYAKPLLKK